MTPATLPNHRFHTPELTALHELGHALVNLCLDIPFVHLEIHEDDKVGWAGQCLLRNKGNDFLGTPKLAASQIAGPIMQLLHDDQMPNDKRMQFSPSIFSRALELKDDLNGICAWLNWESDLRRGEMLMWKAAKIQTIAVPVRDRFEFGWILELEKPVRAFLNTENVSQIKNEIIRLIVKDKMLTAIRIRTALRECLKTTESKSLKEFVESPVAH